MKVAFYNGSNGVHNFVANLTNRTGGANKQQWLLAQTLVANGHDAVFITPAHDSKELKSVIDGIRFVPSPRKTTNFTLGRIIDEEQPAWLYWRSNSMHLGPCFYIAKRRGISLAYACASDKDCDPMHALNPFSYQKHLWPLYRWGVNQADRILVQHPGQQDLFEARYGSKIRQVNSIATEPYITKNAAEPPYIAWVGNLRYIKRPDVLIEIAKQLPQYKFVVCGAITEYRSQPDYAESVSQILYSMSNVDYRGAVPFKEVLTIIAGSSIFLSTSEQEGFPNTFLEAWSLGIPVVSLRLGLGDTIVKHELGYVTEDISETMLRINILMGNLNELARLGENGKRYVSEYHSPSFVYDQLTTALLLQ